MALSFTQQRRPRLSTRESADILLERIRTGEGDADGRLWRRGDMCRVPGVDGLLHNAMIETLLEDGSCLVVLDESSTDPRELRLPLAELQAPGLPDNVMQWTPQDLWSYLSKQGSGAHYELANCLRRANVSGRTALTLKPDSFAIIGIPPNLFAIAQQALDGLRLLASAHIQQRGTSKKLPRPSVMAPPSPSPPRAPTTAPSTRSPSIAPSARPPRPTMSAPSPPGYVQPPGFDEKDEDEVEDERRPSVAETRFYTMADLRKRSSQGKARAHSHGSVRSLPGKRPTMMLTSPIISPTERRTSNLVFEESKLERRKRQYRQQHGIFEHLDDLHPIENPNQTEAEEDVLTHLYMMEKVKRQKNPLHERRTLYRHERDIVKQQAQAMSRWAQFKLNLHFKWRRFKEDAYEFLVSWSLWGDSIKTIEGRYGSTITNYFLFVRWLFVFNLVMALFWGLLVVLPQGIGSSPYSAACDSLVFSAPADTIFGKLVASTSWECTLLFYGFYSDSSVNSYSIPVAYFVMIVVLFLASLIFICTKIANEYANNASYIFDSAEYPFSTHVLGLWDYTLTENESVREMQRGHARQLRLKLQAMVREEIKAGRMAEADEELSIGCLARDDALPVVVSRILVSVFYFGIVGGAAYFVVYLENALSNKTYEDFYSSMLVPLTVTASNVLLPELVTQITKLESWAEQGTELWVALIRSVVLRGAIVGTYVALIFDRFDANSDVVPCWETRVGQEFYRLVILDFAFTLAYTLLQMLVGGILRCSSSEAEIHFNMAPNILDTMYRQALFWLGSMFCPLLPVIGTGTYLVLFFVKKYFLLWTCRVPSFVHQVNGGQAVYHKILLILFLACTVPISLTISSRDTGACGPFAPSSNTTDTVVLDVVSDIIDTFPGPLQDIVYFIGSAAFAFPFVILLLLVIHQYYYHSQAKRNVIVELKSWLQLERMDTRALLRRRLSYLAP